MFFFPLFSGYQSANCSLQPLTPSYTPLRVSLAADAELIYLYASNNSTMVKALEHI